VTPSCRWRVPSNFNFWALNFVCSFQERSEVEQMQIVEMDVLAMTTTESNNFKLWYGWCRVKSFGLELKSLEFWLVPDKVIKVEHPQIVEVTVGLSSDNYHVICDHCACMVGSWTWNHILFFKRLLAVQFTHENLVHFYFPLKLIGVCEIRQLDRDSVVESPFSSLSTSEDVNRIMRFIEHTRMVAPTQQIGRWLVIGNVEFREWSN